MDGAVYAATTDGIYRSADGGASWSATHSYAVGSSGDFSDIAVTETGILYATAWSGASASKGGIWRSADGLAWTNITPAGFATVYNRIVIGIAPSNPNTVYFFGNADGDTGTGSKEILTGGIGSDINRVLFWKYTYLSGDGSGAGGSWENRSANLPGNLTNNDGIFIGPVGSTNLQGVYNMVCKVHPTNENAVFIGATNLYRSTDGFATTTQRTWIGGYSTANNISTYANHHPDQHSLAFYRTDANRLISGHDGGLSRTENCLSDFTGTQPVVWQDLNNGYFTTQFYTLAISPVSGDPFMFGGKQDNGSYGTGSTAFNAKWAQYGSGDGAFASISTAGGAAKSFIIESRQNGVMYRKSINAANQTTDFTRVDPNGGSDYLFINPFITDQNDDKIIYLAAGRYIWRNSDITGVPNFSNLPTSVNWTQLINSDAGAGKTISALAVSRTTANRLYYGTTAGDFFRIDGAHTGDPAKIAIAKTGLGTGYINCITVDPDNADVVFVVFSSYGVKSIFRSTDGGATFSDVSGNIEADAGGTGAGASVRWLAISETTPKTYYIATSTGVYSATALAVGSGPSAGTVWSQEGATVIGNTVCNMIKCRADGLVAVATHGKGIFTSYIDPPGADTPVRLVNEIQRFTVLENAPNTVIDLANTFEDPDGPITLSVHAVSNPSLFQGGAVS